MHLFSPLKRTKQTKKVFFKKHQLYIYLLTSLKFKIKKRNFDYIFKDTSEINCLRLFLGYHGLPLLWSWMVAVGRGNTEEDIALKKEVCDVFDCVVII